MQKMHNGAHYPQDEQYESRLQAAIGSLRGGELEVARAELLKLTELRSTDPRPWLWLSGATGDLRQQRDYLEHALAADPHSTAARRGLAVIAAKLTGEEVTGMGQGVQQAIHEDPQPADATLAFTCVKCGAPLSFDPNSQMMRCSHCGHEVDLEEEALAGERRSLLNGQPIHPDTLEADLAEQPLDLVLPLQRGHRWAASQMRFSCQRCGATILLPEGDMTAACPYCAATQWAESAEMQALVDPNVIAPMKFDDDGAHKRLQDWLSAGFLAPDDLRQAARRAELRPAYYPFWTFDGTLEVRWNCEVNEGTDRNPYWVSRSGFEFENFDDVLVPGWKGLEKKRLNGILPFSLKEIAAFDPGYLAGWQALSYDIPLTDASLKGRELVARKIRRELDFRVEMGREKRNLSTGDHNWTGMTYKLAMLPIWTGSYQYGGRTYPVMINGQTGKVHGEKPRDTLKMVAIGVIAFSLLALLGIGLTLLGLYLGWF